LLSVTESKIIYSNLYIEPDAIAMMQFLQIYVVLQLLFQLYLCLCMDTCDLQFANCVKVVTH